MSFKDRVERDISMVFLNTHFFADKRTIRYDGKEYCGIPVSVQGPEEMERPTKADDHAQGFYQVQAVLFCARADLDGKLPEPGTWLEVNNGKNPKFFGKYQVGAAGDEMGMVRIELGRFAQ